MEKPNTDCPGVYRAQILNPIQVEKIDRYGVCDSSLLSNFRYLLLLAFAAVLPSDSESEDMPVLNFGQPQDGVIQTAFITNDIQRSMTQMTDLLHIGPWFLFESFELFDLRFRGQPADFQVTLALANSGHMQFELILPMDEKPSPYREVQSDRGWGFHHYGVSAIDFESTCRSYTRKGYEEIMSATVAIGARAAYFDTLHPVFGMIEVIEMLPEVEALWTMIRHASVGWDGSEPVRTL